MSRIARRDMLKAMAATSVGAALTTVSGIESVLAAPMSSTPNPNPFGTPRAPATKSPSIVAVAPSTKTLNVMGQEFKPNDTSNTYTPGASVGAIQAAAGPAPGYYRASVNLPNGAVVSQIVYYVIANDTSPTTVWFNGYDATTGGFGPLIAKNSSGVANPAIQALDMGIAPTVIDAVNTWYALYWFPGNVGATHQLYGVRITYMLQPGLYLFPNPRRVIHGDTTPFTSGVTYGPFDATLENNGITPTGVPVGATAAFCAVQSYTAGVLTIFPDLTTDPGIANYGAAATGPLNLTYMMVPLSAAAKFKVHSYITGRCYVDVWGYQV